MILSLGCSNKKIPTVSQSIQTINKDVLKVGLTSITEKYIKKIELNLLTFWAINGLASIDPDITAELDKNGLTLYFNGEKIKSWQIEPNARPNSFEMVTDAVNIALEYSEEIRAADTEEIYEAIFTNVLPHLDKFSRYAGAKEAAKLRSKREGSVGIGIEFKIDKNFMVITRIEPNSPAQESNLQIGNKISHINGILIEGLTYNEIANQLSGPIMTDVTFEILRDLPVEPLIVQVTRSRITPISVMEKHQDGILYFKILNFNHNTANSLSVKMSSAINSLPSLKKGIIIDLRGNPGGLLKQSVKVADIFLNSGEIVSTSGRHPESFNKYSATAGDFISDLPVIVLINGQSASAAEILAAALQDHNRAVIVGSSSFGKGTVQTVVRLPNEGELILTWSEFISPSGYQINGQGVLPLICTNGVDLDEISLIKSIIRGKDKINNAFKFWRAANENETEKMDLKTVCPPNKNSSNYDIEVAEQLLKTPKHYKNTLSIISP